MGVVVRMEAYVPGKVNAARVFRAAFDRVGELAHSLSSYREDSEVRRVERTAWRSPVPVSEELATLLGQTLELARQSDGAFDPTLGRVARLVRAPGWGRPGPAPAALEFAWHQTGWQHVELDRTARTVFLARRGLQLDLGGAAKGFIADEALKSLYRSGVSGALVAVAGDIVAGAPPPGRAGWRVALDQTADTRKAGVHLLLRQSAVSTSGGRERYFLAGEQRCSHVLTRTDARCVDAATAVSVVAASGLEADALATALVALGRARSAALLEHYPHVRAHWPAPGPPGAQPDYQRRPASDSHR